MMTPAQSSADELLTPKEAAHILKVHVATLENWRSMNQGPKWIKLGEGLRSPVRYARRDIDEYLALRRK